MKVKDLLQQLMLIKDQETEIGITCGCRDHRVITKIEKEQHFERYFDEDYKQQTINAGNWYILK